MQWQKREQWLLNLPLGQSVIYMYVYSYNLKAVFPWCVLFCRRLSSVELFDRTHGNDNIRNGRIRFLQVAERKTGQGKL